MENSIIKLLVSVSVAFLFLSTLAFYTEGATLGHVAYWFGGMIYTGILFNILN